MNKIYLIIILFTTSNIFSQNNDYLVFNKKDTVYYERVKYVSIYRIKVKENGKTRKLDDPDSFISGYSSNENLFFEVVESPFSWNKPGKLIYLRRLTDGKIKLFIEPGYGQVRTRYWISKDKSELKYLTTGQLKFGKKNTYKELEKYFADNPKINSELHKSKIKHKSLIQLINKYNKSFEKAKIFTPPLSKVIITNSIKDYKLNDENERFDDNEPNDKGLEINRYGNIIRIRNNVSSASNGYEINIEINDSLKIQKVKYNKWTIKFTHGIETSYNVKSIILRMNKNPFHSNMDLQGEYELNIEKSINGEFEKEFVYKVKFKLFNEIKVFDKYWSEMEYTTMNGIFDGIDCFIPLNKKLVLLSDPSALLEKMKALKREYQYDKKIAFSFIVTNKGLVENNSFRFHESYPKGLEMKIVELFVNKTQWQPAESKNKKTRARGLYVFW